MTFTNPNIVLYGKDGWNLPIGKESIVPTSFKKEQKLMNDLSPSSNKVSVEISDWNKVSSIMTRQEDLRATFYDGATPVFTGYLSNKSTWQLTDSGIKKMTLTFEDVGTRLLGKTFLPSATGEEYVDTTLLAFVKRICDRCGIVLSTKTARNVSIKALVNGKSTCKDILNQVMKETGYVYAFDNYGRMFLYEIPSSADTSYTFDSSNLYTQNSSAVKSDRNIRKYERTRLEFDEYENAEGITVYKDISGKDEEYRNCKIEIPSKGTYPDRTNGLPSTYSCTDIETGKDIVSISNLTPILESIGEVDYQIQKKNSKDISVLITNNKTTSATVTKLEATADVVRVKGTTVLLTGEAVEDSDSDNVYEMKLSYIHTKEEAENTAKVLDWYYKYSDYSYEFYSKDDLDIGSVVRVNEDSISGLDVVVLITEKTTKGNTSIITYKGVAYSPFKTTVVRDDTVNRPPVVIQGGSDGKDGEPGKDGTPGKDGQDARILEIAQTATTLFKNLRSPDTQSITVRLIKSGWQGESVMFCSQGTITVDGDMYTITTDMLHSNLVLTAYSLIPATGAFSPDTLYFKKVSGEWTIYEATESDYTSCYQSETNAVLTIVATDITSQSRFLGVYENESSLPTMASVNEYLIDGDYALVKRDGNGNVSITLLERKGDMWVECTDVEKLSYTTSVAVEEASKLYSEGEDINYADLFYSHKSYIDNLSATVINVSKILAGDITSFNYAEKDNMPTSGYSLKYKGGDNGSGEICASGLKASKATIESSTIARDCTVYGTLINQDENGEVVLKTEQTSLTAYTMKSTRTDGVSTPSAYLYSQFKSYAKTIFDGATGNTPHTVNLHVGNSNYPHWMRVDSFNALPAYDAGGKPAVTVTIGSGNMSIYRGSATQVTVINPADSVPVCFSEVWLRGAVWTSGALWWKDEGTEGKRCFIKDIATNTIKRTICNDGASGSYMADNYTRTFSNVWLYPGEYIECVIDKIPSGADGTSGWARVKLEQSTYMLSGHNFWNGSSFVDFNTAFNGSGYYTASDGAPQFTIGNTTYGIAFSANSSWPSPMRKYYSFSWDTAPTNSTSKTTSFIASPTSMSYNGTSLSLSDMGSATYSKSGITLISTTGNSYTFTVGSYYTAYNVQLTTDAGILGIYAKNLMPVNSDSVIGGSDSAHLWSAVYCNTIYSNNSAPVSKRSLKENIKEWNGDALSLLKDVDIVEYNYISDPEKTYHIGFIADDTDERIAGVKHDRMDTTNCIGVLIKAIQQLSEKIARLESQTNSNGGY